MKKFLAMFGVLALVFAGCSSVDVEEDDAILDDEVVEEESVIDDEAVVEEDAVEEGTE